MSRTAFALLLVAAALAFAGCASPGPGTNNDTNGTGTTTPTTVTSPTSYTPAQAQALLGDASRDFPPEFGFDMKLTNNSTEVMSMKGLFDNATKTSYIEMKMDPSAFGSEAQQADQMGMSDVFAKGMTIYATPHASVWIVNGTAIAMPPDDKGANGMFGGQDPTAAFSELSDPHQLFANLTGAGAADNSTVVKSVEPTVYKGKPAIKIVGAHTEANQTSEATIYLYTNPTRPAHIEGELPSEPGNAAASPFSTGQLSMDFYYGAEVTTKVPTNAVRALGLAYKSDSSPFSGSSAKNSTWTFLVSNNVATSEVELRVKDTQDAASGAPGSTSFGQMPTLWSMKLSDGTKTQDGVTLAFVDNDHDNKVSAGDQVKVSWTSDGVPPTAVLFDTVSGYYVMPTLGFFAALAVLAIAAVVLRRRA